MSATSRSAWPVPADTDNVKDGAQAMRDLGEAIDQATVPVGGIVMFSGSLATLPTNWKLCDGTSGTPDLRGRFIVGAEGAYSQGDTGGADSVALTTAQMPAHTHTGPNHFHSGPSHTHGSGSLVTGNAGGHQHDLDMNATPVSRVEHAHAGGIRPAAGPTNLASGVTSIVTGTTAIETAPSHSHSVSGSTASAGTGNTGSAGTGNTGSTGSGSPHENRPPFYALAYIQRVA